MSTNEYFTSLGYPLKLSEIEIAKPFHMLGYKNPYIRVKAGIGYSLIVHGRPCGETEFNDDGHHVPIVNLVTGSITWMAKDKPCCLIGRETE
jgi:hypothetical protein